MALKITELWIFNQPLSFLCAMLGSSPRHFPHSANENTIACLLVRDKGTICNVFLYLQHSSDLEVSMHVDYGKKGCRLDLCVPVCTFACRYLHLLSRVVSVCVFCCLDLGFPYSQTHADTHRLQYLKIFIHKGSLLSVEDWIALHHASACFCKDVQ